MHGRRVGMLVLIISAFVISACSGGDDAADDTSPPTSGATTSSPPPTTAAPTTTAATASTAAPTTTEPEPFVPPTRTRIVVTGPEEVVFDWTDDQCEPANIPDIAARAFRDADGTVHLTIGHWNTYAMRGPSLDEVAIDCSAPILTSPFEADPALFADSYWIGSPVTADGRTVYAVVHNEYRGDTHAAARPGQCPSGQRLPCLDTSFVMTVSTDGGRTFAPIAEPPGHLIATLPYQYRDDSVPSGIRQPSNVIDGRDGYHYLFGNVSDQPDEVQWVCAMRTDDLSDPSAWRYWDGTDFAGEWGDPYLDDLTADDKCAPLADPELGGSVQESIVYDESIERFVMVGMSADPVTFSTDWGVYYATSTDLVNWTTREFLLEVPMNPTVADPDNELVYAYPSIIDPDSADLSFATTDGQMYVYLSRFNFGGNSLDRDLVRWPIEVVEEVVEAPAWTFDTDGDTEGWFADNHLTELEVAGGALVTASTGDDPWMLSGPISIPSAYDTLTIRMKVSDGTSSRGQIFWVTDLEPDYSESKSTTFLARGNGDFVDYTLDLGDESGWAGNIVALRIDPLEAADVTIEIDSIVLSPD